MDIVRTPQGLYKTNCYILKENGYALIIDPGFHGQRIMKELQDMVPVGIVLTHGHADHICAVDTLVEAYHIPVYMHPKDEELLLVKRRMPSGYKERFTSPYIALEEGPLQIGSFSLNVWEVPGHSAGSVFVGYKHILFTGDTLFKGTIGKVNTYNGDSKAMEKTLQKIMTLDPSYVIYPGHGSSTTLRYELATNPYL
ncbi:MBL fold metallo-hydrolase [Veillonella sp. DNF00869]|uniref:MBL fold metallo-hydrolase n=1 Tax=Veillonella sp. DNF00869 TaxID=1384081 RepID=UPI000784D6F8|nr:MBL fold metallo-hydrolase [Veillonella sp. DNF00869]KXB86701.1 metallo-beta-lactamase domain protein [Veillonella sp. DNF00869]